MYFSLTLQLLKSSKGSGVTVTTLCPGPTESDFQRVAKMEESKMIRQQKLPTAAEVAELGYTAMRAGKLYVVHGWRNRVLIFFSSILPLGIQAMLVRNARAQRSSIEFL